MKKTEDKIVTNKTIQLLKISQNQARNFPKQIPSNPILTHTILQKLMEQMHHSGSQNQFQPKKLHYLTILQNMLKQNLNHQEIKQTVKRKVEKVQGLTYSALVETEEKYLQKYGLFTFEEDVFGYIGRLMGAKEQSFFNEYHRGQFTIKSTIKPPPQPQPQPSQQIVKQVQYVLSHVDLPLSLFKRNDNYWSIDNPKTKQAKQYLKKMRQQDQQFKQEMRKKKQEIAKEKDEMRSKTIEVIKRQQETHKKEMQQKILRKIEELKQNDQSRKKAISESVEFMKERGVPLFKKIQKDFKEKIEIPSIQQKKRKLNQLRQVMRSVPLQQIQQHRQRYQKLKSQHQQRTIVHQPLNISFKSHFYQQIKSMSASRFNQMQGNLSLYQKRLQYAKMVKENHKPAIDEGKKEEIQSRIKLMNKRRARVKKTKKETKGSDEDEEEQEEEEQEEEQEQEPEPEEDEDEDDQDRPKPEKDDQYEPSNKQRYKMGLNYLKVARELADKQKKAKQQQTLKPGTTTNRAITTTENHTISFGDTLDNKQGQQTVDPPSAKKQKFVWVSKYDQQEKKEERIIYKNYLHEVSKRDQSADGIDTSRIKKEIDKVLAPSTERSRARSRLQRSRRTPDIEAEIMYHTNLENKIRNIEERAKNEEELLKFKRINKTQKIKKKMAIDDAVVDTIKARLLMMNKTLDA